MDGDDDDDDDGDDDDDDGDDDDVIIQLIPGKEAFCQEDVKNFKNFCLNMKSSILFRLLYAIEN